MPNSARPTSSGVCDLRQVAVVAVVGNDDANHVCAEVFQALNDVGFTIAAAAGTYWVGAAMAKTDYVDAGPKPDPMGRPLHALTSGWSTRSVRSRPRRSRS